MIGYEIEGVVASRGRTLVVDAMPESHFAFIEIEEGDTFPIIQIERNQWDALVDEYVKEREEYRRKNP